MAIALSYLGDLSRVRIDLSGYADGAVRVERAAVVNGTTGPWTIVRGGTQLPIVGGVGQLDDYEFYADVENMYRTVPVDPASGVFLPGNAGDYASTPDDASLDITGDIDLQADVIANDWTPIVEQALVSKWATPSDLSWLFRINISGQLEFLWSADGSVTAELVSSGPNLPEALNLADGDRRALRVTLDADNGNGEHVVTFWTAPTIDDPWVIFDQQTLAGTATMFSGTAAVNAGAADDGALNPFFGSIREVQIRNSAGVVVADPDFAGQPTGTTNFVDDAGRTWTVNGGAEILGAEIESATITPSLNGETWLKSILYPALNTAIKTPDYRPIQRSARTGIYSVKSRVPQIAVHDAWTSQYWTIETVTDSLADARRLDLSVIAEGTYFLHVPPDEENECFTNPVSGMPGGYIAIMNSTMRHAVGGSHAMQWVFFIRIVAPPAPEIYGTTLTWNAVKRLYGSWEALWASNSTWRDVWDQIMDPEDAVVL